MATFADSAALVDVAELVPAAALALVSPTLPAGEQLLKANLYAICELIAPAPPARRAPASTAPSTPASPTPVATSSAARRLSAI